MDQRADGSTHSNFLGSTKNSRKNTGGMVKYKGERRPSMNGIGQGGTHQDHDWVGSDK